MQQALDLQKIKVSRPQNPDFGEFSLKKLTLKITTWMRLYQNLETSEFRAKMRDIAINFANVFYEGKVVISDRGVFEPKFISSAPYHYFLTSAGEVNSTSDEPYSVTFHEIIDYTNGEIVDSLHINFMVELLWITTEYMLAAQNPKMTILYGMWLDPNMRFDIPFDFEMAQVKMGDYGCHHSKISILKYVDNKIRIIISSANMYTSDWQLRTQGIWVSPFLPLLPETAEHTDGESPTNFKKDFLKYLSQYKNQEVFGWQALIHRTDCSAVNVFFIASVPGNFEGPELCDWGHKRLGAILAAHASLPDDAQKWPVVCQSSAVGVYGDDYQCWLSSHIVAPMSREKNKKIVFMPEFKFIYPTKNNYNISYDAQFGSTPLMYPESNYLKQKWLNNYSYQWKADKVNRTQALPHTKFYTRISPDETEISWFILTSSNVSKGAWGKMKNYGNIQSVSNYEAGVVFIPQFMINQTTFPIKSSVSSDVPVFLLPFDLPLTKYEADDEPYTIPQLAEEPPQAVIESENVETESPIGENVEAESAAGVNAEEESPTSINVEAESSTNANLSEAKEFNKKEQNNKFQMFQEWKKTQVYKKIEQTSNVEIETNEPEQPQSDEENYGSEDDQAYGDYDDEEQQQ